MTAQTSGHRHDEINTVPRFVISQCQRYEDPTGSLRLFYRTKKVPERDLIVCRSSTLGTRQVRRLHTERLM